MEICWSGGAKTAIEIPTQRGLGDEVENAYRAGGALPDIANSIVERGILRRGGARIGDLYDATAVKAILARRRVQLQIDSEAHSYIRLRVVEHASSPTIAAELNARGLRHRCGPWTKKRVQAVIHRLRHKGVAGIEPLPLVQSIRGRIAELTRSGLRPREIVALLNAEGVRTRHRTPIILSNVYRNIHYSKLCSAAVSADKPLADFLTANVRSMSFEQLLDHVRRRGFLTRYGNPFTKGALYRKLAQFGLAMSKVGD